MLRIKKFRFRSGAFRVGYQKILIRFVMSKFMVGVSRFRLIGILVESYFGLLFFEVLVVLTIGTAM